MANLIPRNNDLMSMDGDLFDGFFSNVWGHDKFKVDIKETDHAYSLKADLPGFDKKDLDVHYENGVLSIAASRNSTIEDKDEEGNFLRRERSSSSYRRQFMLQNVDEDEIKAEFKDGVLHLNLPKMANHDDKRKKIDIN